MKREELIEKIKRQAGYVDMLDAYRVVDVYTTLFGVEYFDTRKQTLSVQEELILMWDRINRYEEIVSNDDYIDVNTKTKVCFTCGEETALINYHRDKKKKDGRKIDCKHCAVKKHQDYVTKRIEKEPDYKKKLNDKYKRKTKKNNPL
jgi:hypothetical protein